mmetsp:Transcript_12368/g.19654  ORF Transcript_12368/g.19654 Transcript_12368/m.19654 type:complete len:200 (+) Transcript_12368:719-1318(+)
MNWPLTNQKSRKVKTCHSSEKSGVSARSTPLKLKGASLYSNTVKTRAANEILSCESISCVTCPVVDSRDPSSETYHVGCMKEKHPPRKFMRFEIIAAAGLSSAMNHSAAKCDVEFTKNVWPTAQSACPAASHAKGATVGGHCSGTAVVATQDDIEKNRECTSGPQRSTQPAATQLVASVKHQWQPSVDKTVPLRKTLGT